MLNYKDDVRKVAGWMGKYNADAGTEGYAVAISGGIDSAVVACLAVKAVGKENVVGIALPCGNTPDHYTHDAQELAKNLGIAFITYSMFEDLQSISKGVERIKELGGLGNDLTMPNVKARLRMLLVYALASEFRCLVAGTGNKSELELGYFTKYGDGGVDIEPLGNYLKTEVYQMAKYMPEIPESIITKPPSAALWGNQTDEEDLGMPYSQIDKILIALETKRRDLIDTIPMEDMDKILELIRINKHKNKTPPKGARFGRITKCLPLL
jgi:NAD+ synthase